jgi:hypothetical protein
MFIGTENTIQSIDVIFPVITMEDFQCYLCLKSAYKCVYKQKIKDYIMKNGVVSNLKSYFYSRISSTNTIVRWPHGRNS